MINEGKEWTEFQEKIQLDGYLKLKEQSPAPGTPAANYLYVYAKDKSGVSALYLKDDAGNEKEIAPANTITGTGTANRLAYWTSSSVLGAVGALTQNRLLTADANGLPTSVSALTQGRVMFPDSNGLPTGSANLFWNSTDSRLGILTASPAGALDVRGAVKSFFGNTGGTHVGADGIIAMEKDADGCILEINSHHSAAQGSIFFHKSRGTHASPSALSDGDNMGFILAKGYDGGGYRDSAFIQFQVDGTPSSGGDMPGRIVFATTPDGTASAVQRVRIHNFGGLSIEDGISTPATVTGWATIFVDSADGDLKIKFGDGTVKLIVVDT